MRFGKKFTSFMKKQQLWLTLVFVICFKCKENMGEKWEKSLSSFKSANITGFFHAFPKDY